MKKHFFLTVVCIGALFSCANFSTKQPLSVVEASAQTWNTATEKWRGVKLDIALRGETDAVKILSVIYRGAEVVPTISVREGILHLIANYDKGIEAVKGNEPKATNAPAMVIYKYKDKEYRLPLENIQTKPMVYYPEK